MTNTALYTKISTLPVNIQSEVLKYIETLLKGSEKKTKKKHPKAGCMKGTFKMSEDFKSPLDDFKDYM